MTLTLHSYWRATAPYRVRIGLAVKGLPYDYVPVNLLDGSQHSDAYGAVNRQHLVPALVTDDGVLTQSLAILEWLEETFPTPHLLPEGAGARATVRAMAEIIACDIHPVNNLRILRYLVGKLDVSAEDKDAWYAHWIRAGLTTVEELLARHGGQGAYCFGDQPTMADCCLVPQVYNAARNNCDMSAYPHAMKVYEHCIQQPAFKQAAPSAQPDFQP